MTTVNGKAQALLFPQNGQVTYKPLSSVWEGSDGELLEAMLNFYPSINPEPILDATYNAGRFWVGSKRNVWSMDIDPNHKPMIVADNREMVDGPPNKLGITVQSPIYEPMGSLA